MTEIGNIFEQAMRRKIRFPYRGSISIEDLWDLDVKELDKIFKILNAKLKVCNEESLLGTKDKVDVDLELSIAVIRHIVGVKLAEEEARKTESERAARKQKILEIMSRRQDEELMNKSMEELAKMIEDL